jgi:hypothetical protein
MIPRSKTLPTPVQGNPRPPRPRTRLCRAGVSLILAVAAMQAFLVTGEPLSPASFAVSAAVAGSAGESGRVKHDPSPAGDKLASQSADDDGRLRFFGFLEFDWNFPGSSGVPGFGPLPDSPSHVVLAETSK